MADPKSRAPVRCEAGIAPAMRLIAQSVIGGEELHFSGASLKPGARMMLILVHLGEETAAMTFEEARDAAHQVEHINELYPNAAAYLDMGAIVSGLRWFTDEIEAGRDPTDG